MGETAKVSKLPKCDFCKKNGTEADAHYDGKTTLGPWAFMCTPHFSTYGTGLGTGVGQRLVVDRDDDDEDDE